MDHRLPALVLSLALAGADPASGASATRSTDPARAARPDTVDRFAGLSVNELGLPIANVGSIAFDLVRAGIGLEFPRGSGKSLVFAGGLWIGARAGADTLSGIAEFAQDYRPGPMVGGTWAPDDPSFRVFTIRDGDTTGAAAWMTHAAPLGAPVSPGGLAPLDRGDETLWTIFNDASPTWRWPHLDRRTQPLGVEVRLTAWAFDRIGSLSRTAFLEWEIHNEGGTTLDSAYVSAWLDADLGSGRDDRIGSDPSRGLGYAYNGDGFDDVYGAEAPALGVRILRGARDRDTGADLGLTNVNRYLHDGLEPRRGGDYYNLMRTLDVFGDPKSRPGGAPARVVFDGDPVAGTGWLDTLAADHRFLVATGPFRMLPGDTQRVVAAIVVGQSSSALMSVHAMRLAADSAAIHWGNGFANLPPRRPPPPPPPAIALRAIPNPFAASARFDFAVPAAGARVRLRLYDVRGRRVRTMLDRELGAGTHAAAWDGRDDDRARVPPGVYFARLEIGGVARTARVALVP